VTNTWIPQDLAAPYADHSATLRGALRHHLVDRALQEHLPATPQRVLDIGGGTGVQARMLAGHGHHVTVLDPDPDMLEQARVASLREADQQAGNVTFLQGEGEQAAELAGTGWDVVLNHGVLMYVEDPGPLLHAAARCVRPGGVVSVLAKQAQCMAMRRGLTRDWEGVLTTLREQAEIGRLGALSRGVSRETVTRLLAGQGVHINQWYGVRCFTDHLGDEPVGPDFGQILDAEWAAGRVDPYRGIARLFHLVAVAEQENRA
jgi:S-adenosylmethionine-dependent methyltransferase